MRLNGNLAASCIVLHDNKVLLVRHTYGIAKNKYFVPGGNLQPGELLEQTAVREVFEETSVRIKIKGLLSVRFAPNSAWFIFLADYVSGTPTSDNRENDSALFMDIKEALSSEHVSYTTKVFIRRAIDKDKKIFTLSDYVSTSSPDITRENWRLYD
ncbi:hypothetical protein CDQ84_17990 [Clostridium thermosuccinogenes]|jgi:ADP-ribose pyrophosphatase YjhB (NUDIX family)|uniref:Nudix hydrolase domain-containing protein n=1 Tax=Clostridium thermosuccinogenes TaxID=84032 RepID=A0A2K2F831_9CLOT|nr:NUDIX hydrolase [Pseudoclostridium thermosuccinogenes]AUS95422.1 hypothetical protein CDO33_02570 [Pseudoclostridium thermosuccinogenes]PNT94509.1 hypothetical protein CDQ85_17950 [Pseudoclostridium thermosuccinogenes]PNT94924.1 hypothetical protein CDQ84_17990 [Pseudoclostridium thermosuccinogenes]